MTERRGTPPKQRPLPPRWKRLVEKIDQAYLEKLQKGETPDRSSILSSHPGMAPWLEEHLTLLDALYGARPCAAGHDPGRCGHGGLGVPEQPPERVGPYEIREVLGAGGMAVVYLADQVEPVRRRVALKLIKLGMDTRDVIARFESERQALALMEHPGIAKVFDGGATETGRPYFVMEYVRGEAITDYCDRCRLDTRRRLELFTEVCEAVQHAHQKGIIHRDLKPSNILITEASGRPVPKIIDFGIAKAIDQRLTERTVFTEHGRIVGTVEYMSPEQANGTSEDVDTRTDIYSLGVVLYELLVGSLPFDGGDLRSAGLDEIRRRIRTEDPPKPSTRLGTLGLASRGVAALRRTDPGMLGRLLRGDLDWISMRAMDKDRTRRYASASELAEEIRRHLRDEPVLAGPPKAIYRLRKFVRKHKGPVAAGLALGISLVAGLTVSTLLYLRAGAERDAAEEARRAKAEQQEEAQRQRKRAEAISRALQRLLASVNPIEHGGEVGLSDLLARAAEEIDASPPDDPLIEASLRGTIGQSYLSLGMYDSAAEHLERAREIHRRVLGDDDPQTVLSSVRWGHIIHHRGKLPEAESIFRDALDIQRRKLGERHPATIRSRHLLATTVAQRGELAEAESLYREALEARREVLGEDDEDTIATMHQLAMLLHLRGKLTEAESLFRNVIRIRSEAHGEEHLRTLLSIGSLAALLKDRGEWAEAEASIRHVLETSRRALGDDHPQTIHWMTILSGLLLDQGHVEEAEHLSRQALDAMREMHGEENVSTCAAMNNLAIVLRQRGEIDEALSLQQKALAGQESALGKDHPSTLKSMGNLGLALAEQGHFEEAERLMRESSESMRRVLGADHPESMKSVHNLAYLLQHIGSDVEAEEMYRSALDRQRRVLGEDHPSTLLSMHNLANLIGRGGDREEAIRLLRKAVEGRRALLGQDHAATIASLTALAHLLADEGDPNEAESLLRNALEGVADGEEWLQALALKESLGRVLSAKGSHSEAEALLRESMDGRRRTLGEMHPDTLRTMHHLAETLRSLGKAEEATAILRMAASGRRGLLGEAHPDTLRSMDALATVLADGGDPSAAERLSRRVAAVARRALPERDWRAAYYLAHHGSSLMRLERYREAEDRILEGYAALNDLLGASHDRTREVLTTLIDLYTAWEKPEQAEEYRCLLPTPDPAPPEGQAPD